MARKDMPLKKSRRPEKEVEQEEEVEQLVLDEASTIAPMLKYLILGLICAAAFAIRLFAVVRWESVIHEFDPYFNYRTTKYLTSEGFYDFLNWFDDRAWYPLGRIIGGTLYPGLMSTAALLHNLLHYINITINIRNVCVFLAPIFAANTAIATYLFTKEFTKRESTGLVAAALVAIVPSYISRSVAGSYDNEGVAIFALILTFYLWIKAVHTGSLAWAALCTLAYFYMVAAWGGYVFIINIIPIYVVVMIACGRYSARLYIAYSVFYVMGSLMAMQIPFVGFNVIKQAECAASHGVFVGLQAFAFFKWLHDSIGKHAFSQLLKMVCIVAAVGMGTALVLMQLTGYTQWTGRSLTLLDPTYASKYIPIIASVSEHQPTTWSSFFFDLQILVPLAPVGLYYLFKRVNDGAIFMILYGTISWYFAGIMVRLMLVLAPAACILAAIGISQVLHEFCGWIKKRAAGDEETPNYAVSCSVLALIFALLSFFTLHAAFAASSAYSSPSIVLASQAADGSKVIFDDYREAYYWLRQNTAADAKIMSWWDYGYQMSAMANRTVLVDNNTWNNTHIATVGRAMASPEKEAYPIMKSLDVDYVLAIFGGLVGYSSDDINKFLWMVRIGGGVYPESIRESDYLVNGAMKVDSGGAPAMLNCMMYSMCYYRFDEAKTDYTRPTGFDRVRQIEVGKKNIHLEHLEEAFTSEHWIVRIFKVKKEENVIPTSKVRRALTQKARRDNASPAKTSTSDPNEPVARFLGCHYAEEDFGPNREYTGGATGSRFRLAKHYAATKKARFFAVARVHTDGHSFVFNTAPSSANRVPRGDVDCKRGCLDDDTKACGCADGGCVGQPGPGQEHNRRWAVYELVSQAPAKKGPVGGKKKRKVRRAKKKRK